MKGKARYWLIGVFCVILLCCLCVILATKSCSSTTASFAQTIGTDATRYEKITIQKQASYKTMTDQAEIQAILDKLADVRLYKPDDQRLAAGWSYAIDFYPSDQSGKCTFVDSAGFTKDPGCTIPVPEGKYLPEDSETLYALLTDIFENASPPISTYLN